MKTTNEVIEIYTECTKIAMENNQTVGEKHDYYVTLQQLEWIIKSINQNNKL